MSFKTNYFSFKEISTPNDLEKLRNMRNSDILVEYMAEQKKISREEQALWFKNLDREVNKYFLAYDNENNRLIGYALLKNIDILHQRGEPGTFLIKPDMLGTSKAALFMITFLDYCYFKLGIKLFFGNVLASNSRALANYQIFNPKKISVTNKEFDLESSESYLKCTMQVRRALELLYNYKSIE